MSEHFDEIAELLVPQGAGSLRFGQGLIVSWDPNTFHNRIEFRGGILENLPPFHATDALSYAEGDVVVLMGWAPGEGRGGGSWWIFGRPVIPGGDEVARIVHSTLSAQQMNAEEMNADEINLDGQPLSQILGVLSNEVTGSAPDPDPPPASGTITTVYNASWSRSYKQNNTPNDFAKGLNQGFWSSLNGNQRSLIGFPSSQIQSDHGGRTITRVRVYLYYEHWRLNSGGTAVLGHHGHNSAPSTFSATTDTQRSGNWPKPGGRWVTYTHSPQQWATGTKQGIALGPGPSNAHRYYGTARTHAQSTRPRLEVRSSA